MDKTLAELIFEAEALGLGVNLGKRPREPWTCAVFSMTRETKYACKHGASAESALNNCLSSLKLWEETKRGMLSRLASIDDLDLSEV